MKASLVTKLGNVEFRGEKIHLTNWQSLNKCKVLPVVIALITANNQAVFTAPKFAICVSILQAGGSVNNPGNDKCGKYPIDHAIQHQRLDSVQVGTHCCSLGFGCASF